MHIQEMLIRTPSSPEKHDIPLLLITLKGLNVVMFACRLWGREGGAF